MSFARKPYDETSEYVPLLHEKENNILFNIHDSTGGVVLFFTFIH